MSISSFALQTNFNVKNAMAHNAASELLRVRKNTIRESMMGFETEEHRLEPVLKINGVQYVNDSKATNVNASYYTLEGIDGSIVWIAGGVDKGNDYDTLLPVVNEKVKAIICIGENNDRLIETFGNVVEFMIESESMSEAVKIAYRLTEQGDHVVLSPTCSSYDRFESVEDRGLQFKEAVRNL